MASDLDLYGPLATGSEKALLHLHLQLARDVLIYKVEGLEEADRRRPITPTGTNLIGLVKHLTWIEGWYLCQAFGRPRPELPWERDDDAAIHQWSDMYAKPSETTEELLDAYRAAAAASDRVVEDLDLDTLGHAGQADIVRELIDGATGSRDRPSPFPGGTDEDYRQQYLARVRGEVDDTVWWSYLRSRSQP